MIRAKRIDETTGVLIIEEYKRITYSLLNSHFDELMAAMESWKTEGGIND